MKWLLFDYGVGNIHSLHKALRLAGADAIVTRDPSLLGDAPGVVLPGVGAFGAAMGPLAEAADLIRQRHREGRPLLGICIGMQILYDRSEETPGVAGLGILPGAVRRLPADAGKVPHMGWNTLDAVGDAAAPLLAGLPPHPFVYYVHAYAAPPGDATAATTDYGGPFAAIMRQDQTVGMQFHPEKSSQVGKTILQNTIKTLEDAS